MSLGNSQMLRNSRVGLEPITSRASWWSWLSWTQWQSSSIWGGFNQGESVETTYSAMIFRFPHLGSGCTFGPVSVLPRRHRFFSFCLTWAWRRLMIWLVAPQAVAKAWVHCGDARPHMYKCRESVKTVLWLDLLTQRLFRLTLREGWWRGQQVYLHCDTQPCLTFISMRKMFLFSSKLVVKSESGPLLLLAGYVVVGLLNINTYINFTVYHSSSSAAALSSTADSLTDQGKSLWYHTNDTINMKHDIKPKSKSMASLVSFMLPQLMNHAIKLLMYSDGGQFMLGQPRRPPNTPHCSDCFTLF